MEFADALGKFVNNKQNLFVRHGVISAVTTSPNRVSIRLSGTTTVLTGIRYLATYTPLANDIVVCIISDDDLIVLGKLA